MASTPTATKTTIPRPITSLCVFDTETPPSCDALSLTPEIPGDSRSRRACPPGDASNP